MDQLSGPLIRLHFVRMHAVQERTLARTGIGILVGQRRTVVFSVPAFTANHTGMAPDTGVEVDNKAKLFG